MFALALLGTFLFGEDIEVRISEAAAQAAIDAQVADGAIERFGITVTPQRADISFTEDDKSSLSTDLALNAFGRSGTITGDFRSGIRYDGGKFFLSDIEPITLDLTLDAETEGEVSDLARVLRERVSRERDAMSNTDATQAFDRVVARNEDRIRDTGVQAAQAFFSTIPVYDLRKAGAAGTLARLSLSDVRFENQTAILTLSPRLAAIRILTGIGLLLLLGLYLLLNFPDLKHLRRTPPDPL